MFAVRWENRAKGSSGYVFEASRGDWPVLVDAACRVSTFAVELSACQGTSCRD